MQAGRSSLFLRQLGCSATAFQAAPRAVQAAPRAFQAAPRELGGQPQVFLRNIFGQPFMPPQIRRQENLVAPGAMPETPVNQVGGLANQDVPGGVLGPHDRARPLWPVNLFAPVVGGDAPGTGDATTEVSATENTSEEKDPDLKVLGVDSDENTTSTRVAYPWCGSGFFVGHNLSGPVRSFHLVSPLLHTVSKEPNYPTEVSATGNISEVEASGLELPDKVREEVDDGLQKIEKGELPAMRNSLETFLRTLSLKNPTIQIGPGSFPGVRDITAVVNYDQDVDFMQVNSDSRIQEILGGGDFSDVLNRLERDKVYVQDVMSDLYPDGPPKDSEIARLAALPFNIELALRYEEGIRRATEESKSALDLQPASSFDLTDAGANILEGQITGDEIVAAITQLRESEDAIYQALRRKNPRSKESYSGGKPGYRSLANIHGVKNTPIKIVVDETIRKAESVARALNSKINYYQKIHSLIEAKALKEPIKDLASINEIETIESQLSENKEIIAKVSELAQENLPSQGWVFELLDKIQKQMVSENTQLEERRAVIETEIQQAEDFVQEAFTEIKRLERVEVSTSQEAESLLEKLNSLNEKIENEKQGRLGHRAEALLNQGKGLLEKIGEKLGLIQANNEKAEAVLQEIEGFNFDNGSQVSDIDRNLKSISDSIRSISSLPLEMDTDVKDRLTKKKQELESKKQELTTALKSSRKKLAEDTEKIKFITKKLSDIGEVDLSSKTTDELIALQEQVSSLKNVLKPLTDEGDRVDTSVSRQLDGLSSDLVEKEKKLTQNIIGGYKRDYQHYQQETRNIRSIEALSKLIDKASELAARAEKIKGLGLPQDEVSVSLFSMDPLTLLSPKNVRLPQMMDIVSSDKVYDESLGRVKEFYAEKGDAGRRLIEGIDAGRRLIEGINDSSFEDIDLKDSDLRATSLNRISGLISGLATRLVPNLTRYSRPDNADYENDKKIYGDDKSIEYTFYDELIEFDSHVEQYLSRFDKSFMDIDSKLNYSLEDMRDGEFHSVVLDFDASKDTLKLQKGQLKRLLGDAEGKSKKYENSVFQDLLQGDEGLEGLAYAALNKNNILVEKLKGQLAKTSQLLELISKRMEVAEEDDLKVEDFDPAELEFDEVGEAHSLDPPVVITSASPLSGSGSSGVTGGKNEKNRAEMLAEPIRVVKENSHEEDDLTTDLRGVGDSSDIDTSVSSLKDAGEIVVGQFPSQEHGASLGAGIESTGPYVEVEADNVQGTQRDLNWYKEEIDPQSVPKIRNLDSFIKKMQKNLEALERDFPSSGHDGEVGKLIGNYKLNIQAAALLKDKGKRSVAYKDGLLQDIANQGDLLPAISRRIQTSLNLRGILDPKTKKEEVPAREVKPEKIQRASAQVVSKVTDNTTAAKHKPRKREEKKFDESILGNSTKFEKPKAKTKVSAGRGSHDIEGFAKSVDHLIGISSDIKSRIGSSMTVESLDDLQLELEENKDLIDSLLAKGGHLENKRQENAGLLDKSQDALRKQGDVLDGFEKEIGSRKGNIAEGRKCLESLLEVRDLSETAFNVSGLDAPELEKKIGEIDKDIRLVGGKIDDINRCMGLDGVKGSPLEEQLGSKKTSLIQRIGIIKKHKKILKDLDGTFKRGEKLKKYADDQLARSTDGLNEQDLDKALKGNNNARERIEEFLGQSSDRENSAIENDLGKISKELETKETEIQKRIEQKEKLRLKKENVQKEKNQKNREKVAQFDKDFAALKSEVEALKSEVAKSKENLKDPNFETEDCRILSDRLERLAGRQPVIDTLDDSSNTTRVEDITRLRADLKKLKDEAWTRILVEHSDKLEKLRKERRQEQERLQAEEKERAKDEKEIKPKKDPLKTKKEEEEQNKLLQEGLPGSSNEPKNRQYTRKRPKGESPARPRVFKEMENPAVSGRIAEELNVSSSLPDESENAFKGSVPSDPVHLQNSVSGEDVKTAKPLGSDNMPPPLGSLNKGSPEGEAALSIERPSSQINDVLAHRVHHTPHRELLLSQLKSAQKRNTSHLAYGSGPQPPFSRIVESSPLTSQSIKPAIVESSSLTLMERGFNGMIGQAGGISPFLPGSSVDSVTQGSTQNLIYLQDFIEDSVFPIVVGLGTGNVGEYFSQGILSIGTGFVDVSNVSYNMNQLGFDQPVQLVDLRQSTLPAGEGESVDLDSVSNNEGIISFQSPVRNNALGADYIPNSDIVSAKPEGEEIIKSKILAHIQKIRSDSPSQLQSSISEEGRQALIGHESSDINSSWQADGGFPVVSDSLLALVLQLGATQNPIYSQYSTVNFVLPSVAGQGFSYDGLFNGYPSLVILNARDHSSQPVILVVNSMTPVDSGNSGQFKFPIGGEGFDLASPLNTDGTIDSNPLDNLPIPITYLGTPNARLTLNQFSLGAGMPMVSHPGTVLVPEEEDNDLSAERNVVECAFFADEGEDEDVEDVAFEPSSSASLSDNQFEVVSVYRDDSLKYTQETERYDVDDEGFKKNAVLLDPDSSPGKGELTQLTARWTDAGASNATKEDKAFYSGYMVAQKYFQHYQDDSAKILQLDAGNPSPQVREVIAGVKKYMVQNRIPLARFQHQGYNLNDSKFKVCGSQLNGLSADNVNNQRALKAANSVSSLPGPPSHSAPSAGYGSPSPNSG